MAKNRKYWEEHKLELIPFFGCMVFLGLIGGAYVGINKYNEAKYDRNHAKEAKAVLDTINQAKDTIALSAVKNNQR